jgi:ubiquinone biosynthesis protein
MKHTAAPVRDDTPAGIIANLPRRQFREVSAGDATLSQMRFVTFEASRWVAFQRLLIWFNLVMSFAVGTALDWLTGRDTPGRRAQRLRRAFERNDPPFIKLGMHLAARIDILPWAYCNELARMTDRMEPFPLAEALAAVERAARQPIQTTFSDFDPQPILSSTVACSYQAILRSGEKVIVKVRRPGIGPKTMADIVAFNWLLSLAEALTIFRPGFTRGLRNDFQAQLLEELDFVQEARRQDAFRRAAIQSRKRYFSAPAVRLDISNEEVVVNEFASGLWLWELLAAVEQGHEPVLAQARAMNIDPQVVARRLLWVCDWAWDENLFFPSDPQPNTIIVGPDSTLYFINFTNTGALNRTKRQAMRQILSYARQRDAQNMARAALTLMEPLPPIDLLQLTLELEAYNWQLIYALEATPTSLAWQDRTSAVLWTGIMRLARKYGIVIDLEVLRLLRATLLFESMAVRLHPTIDFVRQYSKFSADRAEKARRRVTDTVLALQDGQADEQLVMRLDRIATILDGFFLRTRHMLSLPSVNFNALTSKWSYAFYTLLHFLATALIATVSGGLLVTFSAWLSGRPAMSVYDLILYLINQPLFQAVLLLLLLLHGRTALFRMDDREPEETR